MTWLFTRVATRLLRLATLLLTVLHGILTFAWLVTCLPTGVRPTLQRLVAYESAERISPPTWLVFEALLAAHTLLLGQEGAFWTVFIIGMTVVCDCRMSTRRRSSTWEITWRWSSATWQRCLKDCSTAIAGQVIEDCFFATIARTLVTKVRTGVIATFQ